MLLQLCVCPLPSSIQRERDGNMRRRIQAEAQPGSSHLSPHWFSAQVTFIMKLYGITGLFLSRHQSKIIGSKPIFKGLLVKLYLFVTCILSLLHLTLVFKIQVNLSVFVLKKLNKIYTFISTRIFLM